MARFYAEIKGNRGEASRMGTTASGIKGHIRGWGAGGRVDCQVDGNGFDTVNIYATSGSRGAESDQLVATIREGKVTLHPTDEQITEFVTRKLRKGVE